LLGLRLKSTLPSPRASTQRVVSYKLLNMKYKM